MYDIRSRGLVRMGSDRAWRPLTALEKQVVEVMKPIPIGARRVTPKSMAETSASHVAEAAPA